MHCCRMVTIRFFFSYPCTCFAPLTHNRHIYIHVCSHYVHRRPHPVCCNSFLSRSLATPRPPARLVIASSFGTATCDLSRHEVTFALCTSAMTESGVGFVSSLCLTIRLCIEVFVWYLNVLPSFEHAPAFYKLQPRHIRAEVGR